MTCNGHDDIECLLAIKFCNSTCELPLKFQGVMIYFLLCPICFFSFLLKYILFLHEKNLYLQCHMLSLAQFSSVAQSCPTLCDTNCSMSGLLVIGTLLANKGPSLSQGNCKFRFVESLGQRRTKKICPFFNLSILPFLSFLKKSFLDWRYNSAATCR